MNKTSIRPFSFLSGSSLQRGQLFGYILLGALLSFEIFNFGSTDFALRDLLGDLRFLGVRWATILALAFCGIDFAGIARLFTPEQVPFRCMASCRRDECDADLVGRFGSDAGASRGGERIIDTSDIIAGCSRICGVDGLADACLDYRSLLYCRRAYF